MAHKTFISYKYDEAQGLRDKIIEALGDDARYYRGEDGFSEDLSSYTAETIKNHLKDMIYDTSVMIVIISPRMKESNWISWEISYALKEYKRGNKHSHTNGVVGVIMKDALRGYDWIKSQQIHNDGCTATSYNNSYMPDVINENRFNQVPQQYACEHCQTVDALTGSYIALATEDDFLANPHKYIENAYEKSQTDNYVIRKALP